MFIAFDLAVSLPSGDSSFFFFSFVFVFFLNLFFNWRKIALQCCIGFCIQEHKSAPGGDSKGALSCGHSRTCKE